MLLTRRGQYDRACERHSVHVIVAEWLLDIIFDFCLGPLCFPWVALSISGQVPGLLLLKSIVLDHRWVLLDLKRVDIFRKNPGFSQSTFTLWIECGSPLQTQLPHLLSAVPLLLLLLPPLLLLLFLQRHFLVKNSVFVAGLVLQTEICSQNNLDVRIPRCHIGPIYHILIFLIGDFLQLLG